MTIGATLARHRQRCGLTIQDLSSRTCIAEPVLRAMESDNFDACGGAFYARGHLRGFARATGTDPDPLIAEFDARYGDEYAPPAIVTALLAAKRRTRPRTRRPNWSLLLAACLMAVVALGFIQVLSEPSARTEAASSSAGDQHGRVARPASTPE